MGPLRGDRSGRQMYPSFTFFVFVEITEFWSKTFHPNDIHPNRSFPFIKKVKFCLIFFKQNVSLKTVGFSRIRTWMIRVEGEHADYLTTTTTHLSPFSFFSNYNFEKILIEINVSIL